MIFNDAVFDIFKVFIINVFTNAAGRVVLVIIIKTSAVMDDIRILAADVLKQYTCRYVQVIKVT